MENEERTVLTTPQTAMLREVEEGRKWGVSGTRSTWKVLVRRGLVDGTMLSPKLTDAGRRFMAERGREMETMKKDECPCGGCVTCDCAAIPGMEEDGLCAHCGGQPLLLALLAEMEPHVGSEAEGDEERAKIAAIIAKGIPEEVLAKYRDAA